MSRNCKECGFNLEKYTGTELSAAWIGGGECCVTCPECGEASGVVFRCPDQQKHFKIRGS